MWWWLLAYFLTGSGLALFLAKIRLKIQLQYLSGSAYVAIVVCWPIFLVFLGLAILSDMVKRQDP